MIKTRYEKTFIGKTTDTIIYLGCKIQGDKLGASRESIDKMRQKYVRLSEQGASEKRLRTYVRRWEGSFKFRPKTPCPARGISAPPRLPWNSCLLEELNAKQRTCFNRHRSCERELALAIMRPVGEGRCENRGMNGEVTRDDHEDYGQ